MACQFIQCAFRKVQMTRLINSKAVNCLLYIVFLLLCAAPCVLNAQQVNYIAGKVTDKSTGMPVPGCSVYFSNTSIGSVTTATGAFTLKNLPPGKYELVVSAIGYETRVVPVSSSSYPHDLQLQLQVRSSELSEVTVQPSLPDGWEKWGKIFLDNFMGAIPNARQCRLLNKDVLRFWRSERNNRLTVRADEPIIIENEALGYTLKYKLEEFTMDFNARLLVYTGYPLFQPMETGNERKNKRWRENREDVYFGSMLYFMRCVYNDRWLEAGFHIAAHVKRPNTEKLRVQKKQEVLLRMADSLQRSPGNANTPISSLTAVRDSSAYYKKILKQPDLIDEYVSLTSLDSLLTVNAENSKSLFFTNKLEVVYKRFPTSGEQQQSEIYLATPAPIRIEGNGSYSSPREVITALYWGQHEKIANLLPYDYQP